MIFVFIIFVIAHALSSLILIKSLYTLILALSIKMTINFRCFFCLSVIMLKFIINIAIYIGLGWGYNIIGILNPEKERL